MWWGCLDPRLSAQDIAESLGVDRKTVWARMKQWREKGFHVPQEIVPNPRLFDAGMGGGGVRVPDIRKKPGVLEQLVQVEGVLGGYDQLGDWLVVTMAHESLATLSRSIKEMRALEGVAEVAPCVPFSPPEPTVELSALDWRIIQAFAADGEAEFADVAAKVGVSTRTLTRRFERMAKGKALWSLPMFDFRAYTGAVLVRYLLTTEPGADGRELAKQVRQHMPGLIWCEAMESYFPSQDADYSWVEFTAHLPSAAKADDVLREAAELPEVAGAEIFFPSRCYFNRAWFDTRVAAKVGQAAAPKARRAAARR